MRFKNLTFALTACSVSILATGCARGDATDAIEKAPAAASAAAVGPAAGILPPAAAPAAVEIRLLADSIDRRLRRVPALSGDEKRRLRRDANAAQITRARELGIKRGARLETHLAQERLVRLGDSTALWALHNLNYSVPYVTPSAEAMIAEIASRFQQKLDSLGVPRYRLVITSALRTPDKQAALRRVNSNASRIESAHEFGTTVDIAYRRFAAPLDAARLPADSVKRHADSLLVETAHRRSAELQAVLGRVLCDMQREGKLLVMMERRQTVFHTTVARRMSRPQTPAAVAVEPGYTRAREIFRSPS